MKTKSNLQPTTPFEINELPRGMAEILFYENVQEMPGEEVERFTYELYCLVTPFRETLGADVENHFEQWIHYARATETIEETPPTAEERLFILEKENAHLREENAITANALDELICFMLGGE